MNCVFPLTVEKEQFSLKKIAIHLPAQVKDFNLFHMLILTLDVFIN